MAMHENLSVSRLHIGNTKKMIIQGTRQTRALVLADTDGGEDEPAPGSIYLSSDRMYLKVAAASAAADWEKVTTSAAD